MTEYQYRTPPFRHQREEFEAHREDELRAIFWEQGVGKSKLEADNIAWLYQRDKINAALILAPSGVHANWTCEELPKHLPQSVLNNSYMFTYYTAKAGTKWFKEQLRSLWKYPGLRIMAMAYDSIMTEPGRNAVWTMLRDHKCFFVADESTRIKTPAAKRTIRVVAAGKYAAYRRILTGTPVPNSPFDIYSQLRFLDPEFWKEYGIQDSTGFRTQFGFWMEQERKDGRSYKTCIGYQHLEYLKEIIDKVSTRVTKDEIEEIDLPPKLFTKRYFDLEPKQTKMYNELKEEFITFLESGEMVTATLAIVRMLRLQQICCGYIPPDGEGEPTHDICNKNPRLELLRELVEDLPHKTIIWARFKRDIDLICNLLGNNAVRYDGAVNDDDRAEAKARFQGVRTRLEDGKVVERTPVPEEEQVQFFVANAATGSTGLTLTAARTVIYYSNTFKLEERLQSEDRAHRIGQEHPVNYIDLIASNTIDRYIIHSLASKLDISSKITGDQVRTWL